MLREIIDALEQRFASVAGEREKDLARQELIVPAYKEVGDLIATVLGNSEKMSSSPEEAYSTLRAGMIEIHNAINRKIKSYENIQHVWDGRRLELEDILNDLKNVQDQVGEDVQEEEPVEEEVESTPPPRQRPRKIGEKPVSLRDLRNNR